MQFLSVYPELRNIATFWSKNANVSRTLSVRHLIYIVLDILYVGFNCQKFLYHMQFILVTGRVLPLLSLPRTVPEEPILDLASQTQTQFMINTLSISKIKGFMCVKYSDENLLENIFL